MKPAPSENILLKSHEQKGEEIIRSMINIVARAQEKVDLTKHRVLAEKVKKHAP